MIRRISFLLVAAWLSSAAHAALVFGPERAISRIEYGSPLGPQRPSGLASDGNGFLAVWSDSGALERQGIYAAPISAAGEIRPESQILIRRAGSGAMVAWNGESYVVFWTESSTLMMVRLSREGRLIT